MNYLVQVDAECVQGKFGQKDTSAALAFATDTAQALITRAFPQRSLTWDPPSDSETGLPDYDPVYDRDGIRVWILPVVVKDEAYFYLVS
ncbi:MAG: hypothetical protein QM790_03060 [Nibricoccus sp.]